MASGATQPPEQLVQLVGIAACYGIEWSLGSNGRLEYKSHYNPQWRIKAVEEKGLKGLYTTASKAYSFSPGEGLVGKAFAKKEPIFVKDVQAATCAEDVVNAIATGDNTVYQREGLAKEYGIHSVYFMRSANGVFEIGTTELFDTPGDMMDGRVSNLGKAEHEDLLQQAPPCNALKALVENSRQTGTCYGIEWTTSKSGCLVYKSHYNPPWRVEAVRAAGLKNLYTTRSKKFTFAPGQGYVGKAFSKQQPIFVGDVSSITYDTVAEADQQEFLRIDLAKEFGIQSAAFIPSANGVIEVGSSNVAASMKDLIMDSKY